MRPTTLAVMLLFGTAFGCRPGSPSTISPGNPEHSATATATSSAVAVDTVQFTSGGDTVPAILSRPRLPGRYPAVVVIHANRLFEPYIISTTTKLAQEGFAALAVDVFHFLPGNGSWEEARQTPGELIGQVMSREFNEPRLIRNIQSGIDFLRRQGYVAEGGVGVLGFCGGGWNALLVAAQSADVGAVVAYYAPVALADAKRRSAMDIAQYVRVPVQYHRAETDPYITAAEVDAFQQLLERQGTPFQRFDYDASHGFFAHNRPVFDSEEAELSWRRTITFLRANVGKPLKPRSLAPMRAMNPDAAVGEHVFHALLH